MNYEKYLTVTMSVCMPCNLSNPMLFLPLKCQHSYHTYLTKRNSAQLPEE